MQCVLPASPNWYCSRIVDCSANGTACIGAKTAIDVWDICADPVKHVCRIDAHHERIVAVSLCHAADAVPQKCCSAGQDGKVKVWNLENRELMHEHCRHKVCCCTLFVHWYITVIFPFSLILLAGLQCNVKSYFELYGMRFRLGSVWTVNCGFGFGSKNRNKTIGSTNVSRCMLN